MTRTERGQFRILPEARAVKKQRIGVGLMGLGVVAGGVARVLTERAEVLARQVGCPIELKKIKVLEADLSRPRQRSLA